MQKRILLAKENGIRLKMVAYGIIVFACAVLFFTLVGIFQVNKKYQSLLSVTEQNINAVNAIDTLGNYSDYLTDQVREYVITMDFDYVEAYFEEIENGYYKQHSLTVLGGQMFPDDQEVCDMLERFSDLSDEMVEFEIHAMKLIAVRNGVDEKILPKKLAAYELTEEELRFSEDEKITAAYYLVFGKEYMALRKEADDTMSEVQSRIESVTKSQRVAASDQVLRSIRNQTICLFLIFGALIALLLVFIIMVLKPLYAIEESMKKQERLKEAGPKELRDLVKAYNHMCDLNAESKVELAHEAEHDVLTGLLNRGAFDKLTRYLQESIEPTALILLDVDNFKGVNDTYGHQIGDEALKRVSELLKEHFRSNDYPARTGGDEFAVIMTNISPKEKDIIRSKLTAVNDSLSKAEGNVPKLSLSAGIAFAQIGYKPQLYKMADEALYKTKENGKCGYTFYGDWK